MKISILKFDIKGNNSIKRGARMTIDKNNLLNRYKCNAFCVLSVKYFLVLTI